MSFKVFHESIRIQISLVKLHKLLGRWSFTLHFHVVIQPMNVAWATKGRKPSENNSFRSLGSLKILIFLISPVLPLPKSEPRCKVNFFFFLEGSFSFHFVGGWEGKASQSCCSLVYFLMEQMQFLSFLCTSAKNNPVNAQMQGWGGISLPALTSCCILQVMDCAMPLIGEHQAEDRQHITELVVSKMNQMLSKTPIPSPQRPTATQQPQVG